MNNSVERLDLFYLLRSCPVPVAAFVAYMSSTTSLLVLHLDLHTLEHARDYVDCTDETHSKCNNKDSHYSSFSQQERMTHALGANRSLDELTLHGLENTMIVESIFRNMTLHSSARKLHRSNYRNYCRVLRLKTFRAPHQQQQRDWFLNENPLAALPLVWSQAPCVQNLSLADMDWTVPMMTSLVQGLLQTYLESLVLDGTFAFPTESAKIFTQFIRMQQRPQERLNGPKMISSIGCLKLTKSYSAHSPERNVYNLAYDDLVQLVLACIATPHIQQETGTHGQPLI